MAVNTAYTNTVGPTQAPAAPQRAAGRITYPATSIVEADFTVVNCGFTPRYIQWCDVTSRIQAEWYEGMDANSAIKTAANGDRSLEVTGITVCDADGTANTAGNSFKVIQTAALGFIVASEIINWRAVG